LRICHSDMKIADKSLKRLLNSQLERENLFILLNCSDNNGQSFHFLTPLQRRLFGLILFTIGCNFDCRQHGFFLNALYFSLIWNFINNINIAASVPCWRKIFSILAILGTFANYPLNRQKKIQFVVNMESEKGLYMWK
jgi:hypothetical protein